MDWALAIVALILIALAAVSKRLSGSPITPAILFVSIAIHSIRHRHLFLEMTNLRELLDSRVDPASRHGRPIGGVAFDS